MFTIPAELQIAVQPVHVAEAQEIQAPLELTPRTAEDFARETAKKYGINEYRFTETLRCESLGFADEKIQSGYYKNKVRENSWGYAQFNLPSKLKTADGRTIDMEIATNGREAIDAAGFNFSIGNASAWSCYRLLK